MPKSYLSDEPVCQRAERNYFDPYLQLASRLRALDQMGHVTDKVELIILGGTWSDYPTEYQVWFVTELFRALNDGDSAEKTCKKRRRFYKSRGLSNRKEELLAQVGEKQQELRGGSLTYNQAIGQLYEDNDTWKRIALEQSSDLDELARQQGSNETAQHRVVGLVVETRPDTITCDSLTLLRRLGCTKLQMGIQSLSPSVLRLNNRSITLDRLHEAFELARVFGFKLHAHFMLNLYGSTCENDKREYERFVTDARYLPDEVKLYPCALVGGTELCKHYADKTWQPYREAELIDILTTDLLNTPPYIRVSRMIRDISAHDILAGNKKANLRQLVERRIEETDGRIVEIRYREISTDETDVGQLRLETLPYETTVTDEFFLQWVTPENRIAGFLRLSLPKPDYLRHHQSALPVSPYEAMIREVHVYGRVAGLHKTGEGAQHLGLGRRLIETACAIAKARGYEKVNVISSIGTREYYRSLGFKDDGLYQQLAL
jgi:elongator complex protein 3